MGSSPRHSKNHIYHFPLSPPSSGSATADSSPRLSTLATQDSQLVDKLFASTVSFRQSHSLTPVRSAHHFSDSNAIDSDGYNTERSRSHHNPRKRPRKAMTTSICTPSINPSLIHSPPKSSRSLSQTSDISSTSSSSSSSSPTSREESPLHPVSLGMGRKVAATLQLFKETTGSVEEQISTELSSRPETSSGIRRAEPFRDVADVAEAQFEFVKRSEWPDRETAAVRRDRSMTTLERARTREGVEQREKDRKPSTHDRPAPDSAQWRRDVITLGRGRRLERTVDDESYTEIDTPHPGFHDVIPPFIRPRPHPYPPSPSPSRSPTKRIPPSPYRPRELESSSRLSAYTQPSPPIPLTIQTVPPLSRSPTRVRPFHHQDKRRSVPISPSISPWSTDDDSAWETASVASASANSSYFLDPYDSQDDEDPLPLLQESHDDFKGFQDAFTLSTDDDEARTSHSDQLKGSFSATGFTMSEEHLPHIPLRPFRNQVGGHSAIYKFTKQAVCKVGHIA